MALYISPGLASDAEVDAAVQVEAIARAAADLLEQDAATAATDVELAAAVASLGSAISLKQDSATAATDAEMTAAIAGVVTLAPATSARNMIVPTAVGAVPLIAKGMVGQTANLFELQDSSGGFMAFVSAGGTAGFANRVSAGGGSAALAQLDVSVSTPARIGFVVRAAGSQTANLTEWRNSAETIGAFVNASREMYMGGRGGVGTLPPTPTGGRVFSSGATAADQIPIVARGFASQTANLQEWQDSTGGVTAFVNSLGQTFVGGRGAAGSLNPAIGRNFGVGATAADQIPLLVKGFASQTANLQEWQDSAGTAQAWVSGGGSIVTTQRIIAGAGTGAAGQLEVTSTLATRQAVIVRAAVGQSANIAEYQNSAGTIVAGVSTDGALQTNAIRAAGGTLTRIDLSNTTNIGVVFNPPTTASIGVVNRAIASMTGNMEEWQNSASTALALVSASGSFRTSGSIAAGTTAGLLNSQIGALATTATVSPLVGKGAVSQTANLLELRDSADAVKLSVAPNGALSMGDTSQTTPMLIVTGGSAGTPMIRLIRTGTQFSWALTGGTLSFTDDTNGAMVGGFTGSAGINNLFLGPFLSASVVTRPSMLSATTHQNTAGADVAGQALRLQGGLGVGTSTPGDIEFWTGASQLTTVNHVSSVKARITSAGDLTLLGNGKGVSLKSPDGLTTKKLTIDNAGALALI